MTLTPRLVGDILLKRLGRPDSSEIGNIVMQIPEGLKLTARRVAENPATRALLLSDKTTAKVAIGSNGKVSLVTAYNDYRILKEYIGHGQMYLLPAVSVANSSVETSANELALGSAANRLAVGDKVQITTTGSLPGGIAALTDYYVKTWNPTTYAITLAPSADLSSVVDITSQGSGTHTVTVQESADFPLQWVAPEVAPLDRYLDVIYRYYNIEGDTMQIFPRGMAGQVAFAVPTYPSTLAQLPESAEAEAIFLEVMLELLTRGSGGDN